MTKKNPTSWRQKPKNKATKFILNMNMDDQIKWTNMIRLYWATK